MRLRGVSSINSSSEPLFILDGSPISSGAFTALNPNDIESMTVLKDASSTAIYGSRAANGVVILTSKRGKRGEKAKITGVTLTVEGLENIPKEGPCVFVGNHRSYYDIPLLLASLDKPHGILAKEELEKIPLLNRWMKLLGCVFVQRDDLRASVRALNDATAIVESGRSFVIFPEGTRYKGEEGGVGEFKNGAFRIAVKTGAPVIPVAITGARALFENNGNRCHPGRVHICILPPIRTAGMSKAEQKQLPEAVRQTILAKLK